MAPGPRAARGEALLAAERPALPGARVKARGGHDWVDAPAARASAALRPDRCGALGARPLPGIGCTRCPSAASVSRSARAAAHAALWASRSRTWSARGRAPRRRADTARARAVARRASSCRGTAWSGPQRPPLTCARVVLRSSTAAGASAGAALEVLSSGSTAGGPRSGRPGRRGRKRTHAGKRTTSASGRRWRAAVRLGITSRRARARVRGRRAWFAARGNVLARAQPASRPRARGGASRPAVCARRPRLAAHEAGWSGAD